MKKLIAILLMFSIAPISGSAAIFASDNTAAGVQSIHDDSGTVSGDTITVGAGTFTWTSGVVLTKAIRLLAAGTNSTTVIANIGGATLISVTVPAGAGAVGDPTITSRVSGFRFQSDTVGFLSFIKFEAPTTGNSRFRMDHNVFDSVNQPCRTAFGGYGVFDHNTYILRASGIPAGVGFFRQNSSGSTYPANTWGDKAWADDDHFGTDKFVFEEDFAVTNLYTASELTGWDGLSGGRGVIRFGDIGGVSVEWHGLEDTRDRSMRAIEIYGNTFRGYNVRASPIYGRGGIALVASNTLVGWNASSSFSLLNNRSIAPMALPIGGSSGNNAWDVNNGGNPLVTCTATSSGTLTVTDSSKTWTTDQWKNYIVRRTSGTAIPSGGLTRSGSTVTVNTSTAHGLTTGDSISIWGANEITWQNAHTAIGGGGITVVDADTFTFVDVNSAVPTATGSGIKCAKGAYMAIINGNNTAGQLTISGNFYGTPHNLVLNSGDTYEINQVVHSMDQPGRAGGGDLAGDLIPSLPGGWNNQTNSLCHQWQNTLNGGAISWSQTRSGGAFDTIVNGVHFTNNVAKPGWVPYTYPHPLIALTDSPTSPTTNTMRLRVLSLPF